MIDSCKANRMRHIKLSELKIVAKKNSVKLELLNEVESFLLR